MSKNYKNASFCLILLFSFSFLISPVFSQDYVLKKLHVFKGIEDNVIVSQHMGKDANGNIFGFRTFREKFIVGKDSFSTTSSSNSDVLISRFAPDGEISSNIHIDYSGFDKATDVAISTKNEIYVSGTFHSPFADSATILLKCNDKGKVLWKLKVSNAKCMGQGVCVDDEGNCYVAGYIIDSLVIDKYRFKNDYKTRYGAFIIKLSPDGKVLWVKATSAQKEKIEASSMKFERMGPHIHAIRPDKSGNLYFVGHFSGHGSLDTFNIFTSKNFNIYQTGYNETYYLGKIDKNGQILWITNENSPDRSGADKLMLDSLNNIYIDVDNYGDGVIQKYSPDGRYIGSIKKYLKDKIAVSPRGNIFLSRLGILNFNKDTIFNLKGKFSSFPIVHATSDNSNNIYLKSGVLFTKWDTAKIEGYKINGPAVIYAILNFPVFNSPPRIEETNPPDLQNDDSQVKTEFKIYPNPALDLVNIELYSGQKEQVQTEIVDMFGKIVSYTSDIKGEGNYKFGLQLHKFRAGMYIFRVKVGEKLYIRKLVKL